jgi:hypothetical protein
LEASDYHFTADVAFGKAPDAALWILVSEGEVEHTAWIPIQFRRKERA